MTDADTAFIEAAQRIVTGLKEAKIYCKNKSKKLTIPLL